MRGKSTDVITLSLPAEARYASVARIVVGGLAARLDFPYEAADDLQLAVESVLAVDDLAAGEDIVIDLNVAEESLTLWLGPLRPDSDGALDRPASPGLDLRTVLGAVVDRAEVTDRDGERWLVLEKAAPGRPRA